MDCIDNPTYRDTQECIEMICAPGCGLHGEFTKPADNYYEQEGVSGNYGCYNYDFNYKCPDNIPFPYNPNGENAVALILIGLEDRDPATFKYRQAVYAMEL